jgi:hypothetical protein
MDTLTPEHPQANTPMRELNVEIRNKTGQAWRSIKTWKISRSSFNQLRGPWKELNEFRVVEENQ